VVEVTRYLDLHDCHIPALHDGVIIHPFVSIRTPSHSRSLARTPVYGPDITIGSGSEIGPHAVLYLGCTIGAECLIGDGATVREGAVIGNRCVIGTRAFIGYDAVLADEVRVQTGAHIADGWTIGRGTFVGINVSTMSDRNPQKYEFTGSHGSTVGTRCLIGSGAVILGGLTIGDDVVIGAGALVTGDVASGSIVLGQPSRVIAR
jgi:acetyltransferase-like isoleucine patch superfamily enzyme